MKGWYAIYLREMLIIKRRALKMLASMSVTPALYLVAFGYGMGRGVSVSGHSYTEFLVPGLVAMASMNHAFAIAGEINISRFYWKTFEEFQAAPIRNIAYVTGEVLTGMTRALVAASVIIVIGYIFGVRLSYDLWFWLGVLLNGFVFSSVAVIAAMMVKSHADQNLLNNFIITPMAFLGGTVFPLSNMPEWAQWILKAMPLTHASHAIRESALGHGPDFVAYIILLITGSLCFAGAFYSVDKARY